MRPIDPCCGASVGALITRSDGALLMIERGWYPVGMAPPGGHDDHNGGTAASIAAEVTEEVGLTATSHEVLADGLWLPNLCQSPPAAVPGHWWTVARVEATGALAPDPVETKGARWVGPGELEELVEVTVALAVDELTEFEFADDPGLEPIWIELLHAAGVRTATARERRLARRLYTTPPTHYWHDAEQCEVPVEEYAAYIDRVPA